MTNDDYKTFRREWSERQKTLSTLLNQPDQHQQAVELFLQQHTVLHTAQIAQPATWSFADELLDGMSQEQMRQILPNQEQSVVWLLWHMTRIEDVALNMLVAELR